MPGTKQLKLDISISTYDPKQLHLLKFNNKTTVQTNTSEDHGQYKRIYQNI